MSVRLQYDSLSVGVPTISNCTFVGNSASSTGGAISLEGLTANITGSYFLLNGVSGGAGGAVFATGCDFPSGGFLSFSNSSFLNNSAYSGHGGAVAIASCGATFSGTVLEGNVAGGGGAVYAGLNLGRPARIGAMGPPSLAFDSGCVVKGNSAQLAVLGAGSGVCTTGVLLAMDGGVWEPANAAANASSGCNFQVW